jgi:Domain of unknown function (DUF4279)
MASIAKSAASLRIFGDLEPEEISFLLGEQPTLSYRKGEERHGVLKRKGAWLYQVPDAEPGDLDSQIRDIFERLTHDLTIWLDLAESFEIDVFAGIFMEEDMEGFTLKPETLVLLTERQISIGFDIYAPGTDEPE